MKKQNQNGQNGKKGYTVPKVETLTAKDLQEAVGPVQGLSSGPLSSAVTTKKKTRGGHGRGHGRGPR